MKTKKLSLSILIIILGLLVILTGCGQETTTSSSGNKSEPKAEPKAEPIILGVAADLGAIEGADGLRAAQLAVEEINAKGGVLVNGVRRPFEIVQANTRDNEPGLPINDALAGLEKLIVEKKPVAIVVGSGRSEVLLSAMDLVAKYKIPYFTWAVSPGFEAKIKTDYEKYKYFFRPTLNAIHIVQSLTSLLDFTNKKLQFNKLYILNQDVIWAKGTADGVEKWAKENGWNIVGRDAYPTGASDFSSSLGKARKEGAQLIMPIFDMPQAGVLVKQAETMQVPALIGGYLSPAAPASSWKAFNGEIGGLINVLLEGGSLPLKAIPKSVAFYDNFVKKFGPEQAEKMASHELGPAYDTVYLLAAAIERAGSMDSDKMVTEIEKTDMDGVIGRVKFNKEHQAVFGTDPKKEAISVVFQWRDGKRIPVYPEAVAESEIQLPASNKK